MLIRNDCTGIETKTVDACSALDINRGRKRNIEEMNYSSEIKYTLSIRSADVHATILIQQIRDDCATGGAESATILLSTTSLLKVIATKCLSDRLLTASNCSLI